MNRLTSVIVASVLSCLLTFGLMWATGIGKTDPNTFRIEHRNEVAAAQTNYNPGAGAPFDFTFAADQVSPAVVFIRNTMAGNRNARQGSPQDLFEQLFPGFGESPRSAPMPAVGAGSGVIISPDGYIVTNNHVIDKSIDLEVRVGDRDIYKATLIGTDPTTDIALLKIDAPTTLPFVEFADSDQVKIGQWVAAVGNPFELETTVTAGIVSAKGRSINIIGRGAYGQSRDRTAIESFIQTDAAVNPGNSGGALVNVDGKLVGINTAIASPTGAYTGYSFAVPSNLVRKVADDLREFGTVQRGFIGANIIEVNQAVADEYDLNINYGVYVDSLTATSSAKEAGIRKGDVITAIDGKEVRTSPELLEMIGRKRPGDQVEITYNRKGDIQTAKVTLKSAEGSTERIRKSNPSGLASLGIEVEPIDEGLARRLGVAGGVRVSAIRTGRIAAQTDMSEGFVITKAGKRDVRSVEDFKSAIEQAEGIIVVRGYYENVPGEKIYAFDPS